MGNPLAQIYYRKEDANRNSCPESGNELPSFMEAYGSGECDSDLLAEAVKELYDNGSIEYARDRAMFHHSKAHSCLDILGDSHSVKILREMTDYQLVRIN